MSECTICRERQAPPFLSWCDPCADEAKATMNDWKCPRCGWALITYPQFLCNACQRAAQDAEENAQ